MDAIWNRLNVELLVTRVVTWLPSLAIAFVLLIAFWILYRATEPALTRVLKRSHFEAALINMLVSVYRVALLVFALVMAASQLGVNVGAALAGLGVVGLTIGFAAKDSLSNIMAGFLIFWDKPFHIGDWVTLDDNYGEVAEITMRTTRLRTRGNKWVIIPNEAVISRVLINHSFHGKTRVEVEVGIGYKESIAEARKVIIERVKEVRGVIPDPAPSIVVKSLGASSVDLQVMVWVADAEQEKPTYCRVAEAIKNALDDAGIEIPFPHMQLLVDAVDDTVWDKASELAQRGARA